MKLLLVGYFAFKSNDNGGQPVKSRELYNAIVKYYGFENVQYLETLNWKKRPIRLFLEFVTRVSKSDIIIMMPSHNGVKVFSVLLSYAKKFKKEVRIYYSVIGGWLPDKISKNRKMKSTLRDFDGIWVETTEMKNDLVKLGLDNITVIKNFKVLTPVDKTKLESVYNQPFKLCTFSRVMKEKGIEDAINAVKRINIESKKTVFELDIYGQIDNNYLLTFNKLKKDFPEYITYKGVVEPNESVDVIKTYFALLFPTLFYTEGIPGTLIDALASGVPVICSLWLNYSDIFVEGETGFGYSFGNFEELIMVLRKIKDNPNILINMKSNCISKYSEFEPAHIMRNIDDILLKSK